MAELLPWLRLLLARGPRLSLGVVLMLATLLAGVGLLSLSGWFITATGVTALAWAVGASATIDIYVPGGGIRFFALGRTVSRYLERLYNHDVVLRLLADLRVTLFRSLTQLDVQAQSRYRASQWLNRLTRDINTLDNLYLRLLAPPAVMFLGVVTVGVLIGFFLPFAGWLAALLLLATLLLATVGMAWWGRSLSHRQVHEADRLRVKTIEQLQGLAELSAWRVLPEHQQHLVALEREHSDERFKLDCRAALGQSIVLAAVQVAVLLTLALGLLSYRDGMVSGPVLVMLPLAIMALSEGFALLPKGFLHWGGVEAAAQRLNEQQSIESRLPLSPQPRPAPPRASSVTLADVKLQHASPMGSVLVFDKLNLTLHAGEKLAVVGTSGAGKSTLAAIVARLLDPTSGSVKVGDTALTEIDPEQWHVHTAVLTQEAHLFNESLAFNLRVACPSATDEHLWQVLDQVALRETVERFKEGLDTQVGEFGCQLSGGEARRVALARIILRDSPLVILDEPFSGLDRATAAQISSHLNRFLRHRTALLLAHELSALPQADRVLKLSNGHLHPGP